MAVLRRVTPANPISNFPQTVSPGPTVFDGLAAGAEAWGRELDMLASEQARRGGAEQGAAAAGGYTPSNPGVAPPGLPLPGRAGSVRMTTPNANDPRGEVRTGPANSPIPLGTAGALPVSGDLTSDPRIYEIAQNAWGYIMPPGSRIEVSSAHRPGGSTTSQHHSADAIDFAVIRPDGSRVRWDDPEALQATEFGVALGAVGIGAGFDYMGGDRFHWDLGENPNAPRAGVTVWSDSDGVNNRDPRGAVSWLPRLQQAREMGLQGLLAQAGVTPPVTEGAAIAVDAPLTTTPSSMNVPAPPATTAIRNEAGQLETRPLDIFTSRYDIIRENAALGAYAGSVLNNASLAMSDLRRQFPLDPDGFRQAAQGYISELMRAAPAPIREQMLSDLQLEAGRTMNGILSARFEDTMSRARNEISARIETTAGEYSTLLAAGDSDGAAVARANLESALRYRETLPGSGWGPEQSNLLLAGAEREAERIRTTGTSNRQTEIGAMLSDIRRERHDGRISSHESVLYSPDAQSHPEYLATLASVEFGNFMGGSFAQMPAEQRAALISDERGRAVDDYDREWLGAMEASHTRLTQLEMNDPMAAAAARGVAVGAMDPTDPQSFLTTLAQRRIIADQMVAQGFASPDNVRLFTNADRDMLAPLLGEASDPQTRFQVASSIIATQGESTVAAMRELGVEESVAQIADLARATGSQALLQEGLTGAALRATQQARVGNVGDMLGVAAVAEVVNALPMNAAMRQTVIEMGLDILAARTQGGEPTDEQRREAISSALGRIGNTGGVQDVFGTPTFLPPGMAPSTVEGAFNALVRPVSAANMRATSDGRIELLGPAPAGGAVRNTERPVIGTFDTMQEAMAAPFADMPQGVPMLGDEPFSARDLSRGRLEPVMRGGQFVAGVYRMVYEGRNGPYDVTDADGNAYIFNLNTMAGR